MLGVAYALPKAIVSCAAPFQVRANHQDSLRSRSEALQSVPERHVVDDRTKNYPNL